MASDIMQQVQEDSRKKKQQGVLSRLSSTAPRSAGVGGYGTPEPTVVEKAKEVQEEAVVEEPASKQTARRLAADLREDGTTTESWEAARQEVADRGARYRAALQPKKGFEERYDADVKFQEEEYGEGSLERDRMLAEIMGQEHQTNPDPGGVEGTITDPDLYEKYYFEAQEKTPWAQKEQLQDAAIKGVMAEQAERAALEAEKFPEPLEAEATETVGGGLGYEKTIEELRQEKADREAAAKKKEGDQAKAAADTIKRTGPGGTGTRRQPTAAELAARKALEPMDMDEVMGETAITAEAPEDPGTAAPPTEDFRGTLAMLDEDEQAQLSKAPGGKFLKPALDSLLEGDLGGFNEAFGKIPRADGAGLPPGAFVDNDRRGVSLLNTAMGKTPQFKRQVASDLTKAIDKDNSKIYKQVSSELETVLLKKLYSEYEQLGREKPQITDAENQKAREDAQRAAKIIMGLQVPDTNWMGDVKRLGGRTVRFTVAKNNPQYEILQGLIGDEIDSPWLGQNLSEDARKNMRENYSATETLGTLLGTTIRRGRFAVLKDAKSEGDTTPDDSPVEDIVASAAEEQEG